MDIKIEFNPSALKHKGMSEARIQQAVMNPLYDGLWEGDREKRLLLGLDAGGNVLEIMYNFIDERTINVFHAMKCRSIYYRLLDV